MTPQQVFFYNGGNFIRTQRRWLWLVVFSFVLFISCTSTKISDPVRVTGGLVSGTTGSDTTVKVYKGIPYAAPPVGDMRWRPPQPVEPWDGVKEVDEFCEACIQNLAGSRLPWTEEFMHQGEISEDCLYLNVWTAAASSNEKRPVLVYIHGGGFNEGSGSVDVYNGEVLAKKGLVVITINYRLGLLGFLAHPDLTEESPEGASGNYGLLDQVAALEWVQDNIRQFGGDPDNVAIAGQSAGAMSVYLLTASPLAEGLFHRAIVQSGPGGLASFGMTSTSGLAGSLSDAEESGLQFAQNLGVESIEELRAMPVDSLAGAGGGSGPVVDGYFLPEPVETIFANGDQNDVPTISGMNADEASAFPGYGTLSAEEFRIQAQQRYGDMADEFLELYPADTDEQASQSQKQSSRDLGLVALQQLAAERNQTANTDIYLYIMSRGIPWPEHPEFGAFHTAEVPYVFDNLHLLERPWTQEDRVLADTMSSFWVEFADSGNPNESGLPTWPAFDQSEPAIMQFDVTPEAVSIPNQEKVDFFQRYLSQ